MGNETRRGFCVINVIGPDRFNRMVQDIGKRYAQAYGRKKTSLARSKSMLGHFFHSMFNSVAGRFQTFGRGTMESFSERVSGGRKESGLAAVPEVSEVSQKTPTEPEPRRGLPRRFKPKWRAKPAHNVVSRPSA